jgi:hypothetical protein
VASPDERCEVPCSFRPSYSPLSFFFKVAVRLTSTSWGSALAPPPFFHCYGAYKPDVLAFWEGAVQGSSLSPKRLWRWLSARWPCARAGATAASNGTLRAQQSFWGTQVDLDPARLGTLTVCVKKILLRP